MKFKKFMMRCMMTFALLIVCGVGSRRFIFFNNEVPELPNDTDPVVEQTIEDDDTPL